MVDEKRIKALMDTLDLTREEALQVIADDEAIDRGAKMFELDPELAAGAKKARQVGRKAGTPNKRERKEDTDKRFLVRLLGLALANSDDEGFGLSTIEVTNPEREIVFTYNGRKFKVVLSAPRT